MEIKIAGIERSQKIEEERIGISITKDTNLKCFIVVTMPLDDYNDVTKHFAPSFRLPDVNVTTNDYVILMSGTGVNRTATNKAGGVIHILYWNRTESIWNNAELKPNLLKLDQG